MRKLLRTITLIATQTALAGSLQIANAAGTTAADFLKMGAGARAAAMGEAYSSVSNDVTAGYWNPAGLSQIESAEVAMMHNAALVDTQYQYVGGALPTENGALGASLQRMDYDTIDAYDALDAKQGSFDASSLAINLTYSKKISETLNAGVTGKLIQESLEAEKASGFGADFGLLMKRERVNLSAVIQHLGTGLEFVQEKQSLPTTIRLGASTRFLEEKLTVAADLVQAKGADMMVNTGAEYRLSETITLRGGYRLTPGADFAVGGLTGLTGGLGLNLGQFSIDYAMMPFGDLGNTHRVSLLFRFAKP
jgi:hypothetical protein